MVRSERAAGAAGATRPIGRCRDHALDECVFEQPLDRVRSRRFRRPGGSGHLEAEPWSASYLWAHDRNGRLTFLLRVGPTRMQGASFRLRYALNQADEPRAVLTSHDSHCQLGKCRPEPGRPVVPDVAVALADSPVAAHFRGWNRRGEKVWVTRLFDADLFDLLEQLLTPAERQLLCYRTARAALDVCARLHPHGIGHGDIKAENFFWSATGEVVLGDFDLAFTDDTTSPAYERRWRGTPHYMAPEAHDLAGRPASVKSDLFSLGLTLLSVWSPHQFDLFILGPEQQAQALAAGRPLGSRTIQERHALLGAWLDHAAGRSPAGMAAKHEARWGFRWRTMNRLSADLRRHDEGLASLIFDALLPVEPAARGEATALLARLDGLIDHNPQLLPSLGLSRDMPGEAASSPRQALDQACGALLSRFRGSSPSSQRAQRDLTRLGRYAGNRWGLRLDAVSPRLSVWLLGLDERELGVDPSLPLAALPEGPGMFSVRPWFRQLRMALMPWRWLWG